VGGRAPGRHARRREQGSVVIDNTNASVEERAPLIAAAREAGVGIRCVWVDTPLQACLERNEARQGGARVPLVGLYATLGRFVPPSAEEGFDRVDEVRP
jgi:predicted kinase